MGLCAFAHTIGQNNKIYRTRQHSTQICLAISGQVKHRYIVYDPKATRFLPSGQPVKPPKTIWLSGPAQALLLSPFSSTSAHSSVALLDATWRSTCSEAKAVSISALSVRRTHRGRLAVVAQQFSGGNIDVDTQQLWTFDPGVRARST